MAEGLLADLLVLDLSLWQPGHYATQLLADLGADVVKIEPPGGDRMRQLPDRFANFNGHKRSVVLDLKGADGRRTLLGWVERADVVVENYRPGVAARLGVAYEDLSAANPAIVLCSISGFGQNGPLAPVTGHDANYQAYAGAMTVREGQSPAESGLLVGDQGSGLAAAFGILAAVLCARRTGVGEHVDVSMADLLASWVAPMGPVDPRRQPNPGTGPGQPGMGTFQTADGRWVVLGVFSEDHFWDALCEALSLDRHVGLSIAERASRGPELRADLDAAIAIRDMAGLVETLQRSSVPVAPVLSRQEMLQHPHFAERGVIRVGPDGYRMVGHPIRYAVHPALPPGSAPRLDADRQAVWAISRP